MNNQQLIHEMTCYFSYPKEVKFFGDDNCTIKLIPNNLFGIINKIGNKYWFLVYDDVWKVQLSDEMKKYIHYR